MIRRLIAGALLPFALSTPGPAGAQGNAAGWMGVPSAAAQWVEEPVFGGRVMLYRAGREGAPPVVLVHGLGQSGARDWQRAIPALAGDFEVLAFDLPGFGQSDKGNHLYSPANFVRVIEAVVGPRVSRPFTLIGHSMGAAVSLAYAAEHPQRVARLILVDMAGVLHRSVYAEFLSRLGAEFAMGAYPEDAPWFDALVRRILTRAENIPLRADIVLGIPPLRQRMFRGDPNAIAAYALVEHDFSEALRAVRAPTLVVWGSDDRVAPLRTGQVAAATIPGARLAVIQGAGHAPQLQTPERFNAIVRDELGGRLTLSPYALRSAPVRDARVVHCEGQRGRHFTGDYKQLVLTRCPGAQVTNARIGHLLVTESDVSILNSRIDAGVDARNSNLELTGGVLRGDPPLVLDTVRVDAAGTRFESTGVTVRNRGAVPIRVYCSVCETVRGETDRRYVHDNLTLAPELEW